MSPKHLLFGALGLQKITVSILRNYLMVRSRGKIGGQSQHVFICDDRNYCYYFSSSIMF